MVAKVQTKTVYKCEVCDKTHLWNWYQPTWYSPEDDELDYEEIAEDIRQKECLHCYAAHIAIQERKGHRKKLGYVKGAMTKAIKGE